MNKEFIIREIESSELPVLKDMLYEAIFQPKNSELISHDILEVPEVDVYIRDFGKKKDDHCLVAESNDKIVGAVWIRILANEIKGYGNIDNNTPEFAISLFKEYRNQGIGTQLMTRMIEHLKERNYKQASLSVNKDNYASDMYLNLGFEIIKENKEDYLMLLKLS